MHRLLTMIFMLASVCFTFAEKNEIGNLVWDFSIDNVYYAYSPENEGEVWVTSSQKSVYSNADEYKGNIVIPAKVEYNGLTYDVTGIYDRAFVNCQSLRSVSLPSSIRYIGKGAFSNTPIMHIDLPDNLKSIGDYAFYKALLEEISIPDGVETIGDYAFYGSRFKTFALPSSVVSFNASALSECNLLEEITVAKGNTVYDSRNGCNAIIETSTNTLIRGCKKTVIPQEITCIGRYAMTDVECDTIKLPKNVKTIMGAAFYSAKMKYISLPDGLETIGQSAFELCKSLHSVNIPSTVTAIGNFAFYDCTGLIDLYVNIKKPLEIMEEVFKGTYYFLCTLHVPAESMPLYMTTPVWKRFKFPENDYVLFDTYHDLTDTDARDICIKMWDANKDGWITKSELAAVTDLKGAFRNSTMRSFMEFEYFTGLTALEDSAFYGCNNLELIFLPQQLESIGNYAFKGCIAYGASVFLPRNLVSIGDYAYADCKKIEYINIYSKSLTHIGKCAFLGCGLSKIYCHASPSEPPACGEKCFMDTGTVSSIDLYVPKDLIPLYRASTNDADMYGWKCMRNIYDINPPSSIDAAVVQSDNASKVTKHIDARGRLVITKNGKDYDATGRRLR